MPVIVAGMSTRDLTYQIAPVPTARAREIGRWLPLPVVLAGTFTVVLDYFIVNVALPSIQSQLKASDSELEWVVAGFACTSAIFMITAGRRQRSADRRGLDRGGSRRPWMAQLLPDQRSRRHRRAAGSAPRRP
jgi:hypothetical protein